MSKSATTSRFKTRLLRPAASGKGDSWAFVVLPREVSETLPRRGRTTVDASINGHRFQATLEPDGQLSHWLKIGSVLRDAADAQVGDTVTLEIAPVKHEPEPALPPDLRKALDATPDARAVWDATTTIARVDWIHWIVSAKQASTRAQRVANACDMLAGGKRRVCCFDPSGYYSKAWAAPEAAE
ncbi:YdeI/OmpD-associated family protein [Rhodanobacter lindaniclasticus]